MAEHIDGLELSPAYWELMGRLLLALIAGAVLGWEREAQEKPAGLRTHMMVSLGAAIFMIVSIQFTLAVSDPKGNLQLDPLRVLQGIVGGMGFLGAGAIIQSGNSVRGMTTAATIWMTAAIGITAGMGFYNIAIASVIFGIIVLRVFGYLEHVAFESKSRKDET